MDAPALDIDTNDEEKDDDDDEMIIFLNSKRKLSKAKPLTPVDPPKIAVPRSTTMKMMMMTMTACSKLEFTF